MHFLNIWQLQFLTIVKNGSKMIAIFRSQTGIYIFSIGNYR